MIERPFVEFGVERVVGEACTTRQDQLAVEEPLEIRLVFGAAGNRCEQRLAITMRTPGHDAELAAGFLVGEGVVGRSGDIVAVRHCGPASAGAAAYNVVRVELRDGLEVQLDRLQRHVYTTSSCGVCGKSSLEALAVTAAPLAPPRNSASPPRRSMGCRPSCAKRSRCSIGPAACMRPPYSMPQAI